MCPGCTGWRGGSEVRYVCARVLLGEVGGRAGMRQGAPVGPCEGGL